MKEIEELNDRMDGADELINSLIKKITDLEKKEVKATDYSLHFDALQKIFEVFLVRYNKESGELNNAVGKLNLNYPAEQIQQALVEIKNILAAIQKALPVQVKHQFDLKTKGWIIAGMILLIVTAISAGFCGNLWIETNRLQAVGIKYRLVQQVDSVGTTWADSVYNSNPDNADKTLIKIKKIIKNRANEIHKGIIRKNQKKVHK